MDVFSKWTLLTPVKKIEAKLTCRIVEDSWMRRLGTPEVIMSDNATTFMGKVFQALLMRRGVNHWPNARHHSQANPVERVNRTVNACLRTCMQEDQRNWDTRIPEVEELLNTTVHASTGMSPYKILYGYEMLIHGEQHRRERDDKQISVEQRKDYHEQLNEKLFKIVKDNLQTSHEKNVKTYNLRHKKFSPTYHVGQRVFKRNYRLSSAADQYNAKYGPVYTPCVVVARRGTCSYELADDNGKNLGIYSACDMRPDGSAN